MGRYLKNTSTRVGYALRLPSATDSGPEPSNLVDGLIRYNSQRDRVQFTFNGAWLDLAIIGNVDIQTQSLVGDSVEDEFTLDRSISSAQDIMVFIGGVYQQPTENYTVSGNLITFTSPPPAPTGLNPNKIVIVYNLNSTDAD
jgi:hypothetical protein